MAECPHPDDAAYYEVDTDSACNEDGWTCSDCEQRLGFRPDLDRKFAWSKCQQIMDVAHTHGLIYVSTGTMGAEIASDVADLCEQDNAYDQYTMLRWILHVMDRDDKHTEFWQNEAKAWQEQHPS